MKRTYILFIALALAISSFAFKEQSTDLKESMARGKDIYDGSCTVCHMAEGQGIPGVFPPIAKSDYLMKDLDVNIKNMIDGLTGEIEVNGTKYNGAMQPSGLDDQDIADVLNYVRNSWGNKAEKKDFVKKERVAKVRAGK
jgi:nitrite reductase (NO-forming)